MSTLVDILWNSTHPSNTFKVEATMAEFCGFHFHVISSMALLVVFVISFIT